MSRINFVPLIKQEGLQNAIIRNKKEPSPLIGYAKRIETYDDIVSLPSNANGQISVTVKGNTETDEEGTKSTISAGRIKIVGKNLFHPKYALKNPQYSIMEYLGVQCLSWVAGANMGRADRGEWYGLFMDGMFEKGKQYMVIADMAVSSGGARLMWFYDDGTFQSTHHSQTVDSFTRIISISAAGKNVVGIGGIYNEGQRVYVRLDTFQIQKADASREYEPYMESNTYFVAKDPETGGILQLRSLPNGVKDEFRVSEGKLIQRIGHKENVASGTVINYADMTDGGVFYAWNDDGETQAGVKGDTLTIDATQLIYQLASPIITKHEIFGDLKVFPSGTIYFEPTLWGFINFDYGQSSKTITTPDVPIGSLRKVIRYDATDDGRLVETDVTADCTHNGTTLTIANAEPKKTYFYDCEIAPGYYTSAEKIIDVGTHEGVVEHDYGAAAADWVLSTNEALATMLVCKNAGGAAKIIAPAAEGKMYIIRNVSGQTITIKTASSTGITVANGKTATVIFYNTDFIKIGEV